MVIFLLAEYLFTSQQGYKVQNRLDWTTESEQQAKLNAA